MPPVDLYATFRPRLARRVAIVLAILLVIALVVLFAVVPTEGSFSFDAVDYVAGVVVMGIFHWILYMHYQVHAAVDSTGITVKNLIYSHTFTWAEVIDVEFGSGPWARLDISDGRIVSVMAIQYADGEFANREAVRLATLIEHHSVTDAS